MHHQCDQIWFGVKISTNQSKKFQNFGYFGNYGFSLGTSSLAILYLVIVTKEPLAKKSKTGLTTFDPTAKLKKKTLMENLKTFLNAALVRPLRAMSKLFTRPRETLLKVTVLLLLFCYAIYSLAFQVFVHCKYVIIQKCDLISFDD